jgi:inorganic triphosphatase YgiF
MAQELEIKLQRLTDELSGREFEFLSSLGVNNPSCEDLQNLYFDSPELLLKQRKIGLRIRFKSGRLIQTLKTAGQSTGGLHSRGEWEWELPAGAPELDLNKLAACEGWPPGLEDIALDPVFETNFTRYSGNVRSEVALRDKGGETNIEVAIDAGEVRQPRGGDVICAIRELELELISGEPIALFDLADEIGTRLPVFPSDISKAARGYRYYLPSKSQLKQQQQHDINSLSQLDPSRADSLDKLIQNYQDLPDLLSDESDHGKELLDRYLNSLYRALGAESERHHGLLQASPLQQTGLLQQAADKLSDLLETARTRSPDLLLSRDKRWGQVALLLGRYRWLQAQT